MDGLRRAVVSGRGAWAIEVAGVALDRRRALRLTQPSSADRTAIRDRPIERGRPVGDGCSSQTRCEPVGVRIVDDERNPDQISADGFEGPGCPQ
jgi:hypothetical protein